MKAGDIVTRTRDRQVKDSRSVFPADRVWNIPLKIESIFTIDGIEFAACRAPSSKMLPGNRARDPVFRTADLVPLVKDEPFCVEQPTPPWRTA